MDFMKLLKSLEAFVFEVITWLVFYPLTFWKVLVKPAYMMSYADKELEDDPDDYYSDMLSPPIFLAITLGISHLLEISVGEESDLPEILAEDQNLLGYRILIFSIYPLILSLRLLRRKHVKLDRKTLKPPFYSQSFVIAPYALVVSTAPLLVAKYMEASVQALLVILAILSLATIWYLVLQARWFARELGVSALQGAWHALVSFLQALILIIAISSVISGL